MNTKTEYVKAQWQTRPHTCHWPGCRKQVPPAMWGCKAHWFRLPKPIRDEIWKEYRPGQEQDGKPSLRYVVVTKLAQEWIAGRIEFRADGSVHPVMANSK